MTPFGLFVVVALCTLAVIASAGVIAFGFNPKLIAPWHKYAWTLGTAASTYFAAQAGTLPDNEKGVVTQSAYATAFVMGCFGIAVQRGEGSRIASLEADNAGLSRAGGNRAYLLGIVGEFVKAKVDRCRQALEWKFDSLKLRNKHALSQRPHLREIAVAVAEFWKGRLDTGKTGEFRAAIYIEEGDRLVPMATYSTKDGSTAHPTSAMSDAFLVSCEDTNVRPSIAVRCVRKRRLFVVEDCEAAADAFGSDFEYFNPDQRSYLKSIAALWIETLHTPRGETVRGALVVDTDVRGFFEAALADETYSLLQEFVLRIRLEAALVALFDPQEASHEIA